MFQKQKDQFWQLYSKIRLLHRIEPTNLIEESKKFFKSKTYNPQLVYRKPEIDLENLENEIKEIKFNTFKPLGLVYNRKREEAVKEIQLIKVVGKTIVI